MADAYDRFIDGIVAYWREPMHWFETALRAAFLSACFGLGMLLKWLFAQVG